MKSVKLLPHIKMLFEMFNPTLEDCWLDGYNIAKKSIQNDNPHNPGSTNHFYWEEGWWSGYYDSICDNDRSYNNDKNLFDTEEPLKTENLYASKRKVEDKNTVVHKEKQVI